MSNQPDAKMTKRLFKELETFSNEWNKGRAYYLSKIKVRTACDFLELAEIEEEEKKKVEKAQAQAQVQVQAMSDKDKEAEQTLSASLLQLTGGKEMHQVEQTIGVENTIKNYNEVNILYSIDKKKVWNGKTRRWANINSKLGLSIIEEYYKNQQDNLNKINTENINIETDETNETDETKEDKSSVSNDASVSNEAKEKVEKEKVEKEKEVSVSAVSNEYLLNYRIGFKEDNLKDIYVQIFNLSPPFLGEYLMKLSFKNYGWEPPSIIFLNKNGRFLPNQRICLNISDYHKETWSPLYTINYIIITVISAMFDKSITGIGIIGYNEESIQYNSEVSIKELHKLFENLNINWAYKN